jgi:hypothetical protein
MAVSRVAFDAVHFLGDLVAGVRAALNGIRLSGGTTPEILPFGDDTNITLKISGKGTGGVQVANEKLAEYVADGAIAVESHTAVLTKGSAGAYTIAAPASDGIVIKVLAGTSFAHVITGTNLFWAGETGGPFNKFTTAAFIGSGGILVSWNGLWLVVADQIATVGD